MLLCPVHNSPETPILSLLGVLFVLAFTGCLRTPRLDPPLTYMSNMIYKSVTVI